MINFIERNVHGAWVIHGDIGYRQYYYYTKAEAMRLYREGCKQADIVARNRR